MEDWCREASLKHHGNENYSGLIPKSAVTQDWKKFKNDYIKYLNDEENPYV